MPTEAQPYLSAPLELIGDFLDLMVSNLQKVHTNKIPYRIQAGLPSKTKDDILR